MKLAEEKVLFLDCQTTGATPKTAHVLELGWSLSGVSDTKPTIVNRLLRLPDDQELPMRIQRITGITAADMATAHRPADVVAELMGQIGDGSFGPVRFVVAHYAQFEESFVGQLFADHAVDAPFKFICTCQIAKRLYPDLPSRAIRALGGYFGLSLSEMKRSSCHVEATFFIWQRLLSDLSALGIEDSDQLLKLLSKPLVKTQAKKNAYAIPMERLKRLDLPDRPGIYRMLNAEGKILYVGKATSLKSRVNSYFRGRKGKDSKTKELISQIFDVAVTVVATPLEAALLETDLIKHHDPPYNRALRERGRFLSFYNHDFTASSLNQDSNFKFGPFVSDQFKPLLDLLQALQSGSRPSEIFWGLVGEEVIGAAFALFLQNRMLADYSLQQITARKFLALGMVLLRAEVNALRALKREEEQLLKLLALQSQLVDGTESQLIVVDQPDDQTDEQADEEADNEIDEERELDENDVLEMIYGILMRSAKMYLQAKKLTILLNSRIEFFDGEHRILTFSDGCLVDADHQPSSVDSDCSWSGLDINTYDRMRVLMTELARVSSKNQVSSNNQALPKNQVKIGSPFQPSVKVLVEPHIFQMSKLSVSC